MDLPHNRSNGKLYTFLASICDDLLSVVIETSIGCMLHIDMYLISPFHYLAYVYIYIVVLLDVIQSSQESGGNEDHTYICDILY